MNNDAYLNELSLHGQYKTIDDFLQDSKELVFVIGWLEKRHYLLLKRFDLYESMITETQNMHSLAGYRPEQAGDNTDILRKMKIVFLKMCNSEPFWQPEEKEKKCRVEDEDVTGSSVAKASINNGILLSFSGSFKYTDKCLNVEIENSGNKTVNSITTSRFLADELYMKKVIDGDDYLRLRYRNTRLDFSKLQKDFGTKQLEKHEFDDCISCFDKFIGFETWTELLDDTSLYYKSYKPSSKSNNWFAGTEYSSKTIDKFRCINPKRCFGYREGDIFYVLRIERDHSISDNG